MAFLSTFLKTRNLIQRLLRGYTHKLAVFLECGKQLDPMPQHNDFYLPNVRNPDINLKLSV